MCNDLLQDGNPTSIGDCSFCGKAENQVKCLLEGQGGRICDECVSLSVSIITARGITLPLLPPIPT